MLDDGERAVGYVIGRASTPEFVAGYQQRWLPRLRARYQPLSGPPVTEEDHRLDVMFHPERWLLPELAAHPAHLHINLLAGYRGAGHGRELIGTSLASVEGNDPRTWFGRGRSRCGERVLAQRYMGGGVQLHSVDPLHAASDLALERNGLVGGRQPESQLSAKHAHRSERDLRCQRLGRGHAPAQPRGLRGHPPGHADPALNGTTWSQVASPGRHTTTMIAHRVGLDDTAALLMPDTRSVLAHTANRQHRHQRIAHGSDLTNPTPSRRTGWLADQRPHSRRSTALRGPGSGKARVTATARLDTPSRS